MAKEYEEYGEKIKEMDGNTFDESVNVITTRISIYPVHIQDTIGNHVCIKGL